jgi:hypothetical protein
VWVVGIDASSAPATRLADAVSASGKVSQISNDSLEINANRKVSGKYDLPRPRRPAAQPAR